MPVFEKRISPYFCALMKRAGPPLSRQVVPSDEESRALCDGVGETLSQDPLAETAHSPVPRLIHRYARAVLVLATDLCFSHCRFCFRRHTLSDPPAPLRGEITQEQWMDILGYIKNRREIHEVVLSGGDPMTLKDASLGALCRDIRALDARRVIRVATRAAVFCPDRLAAHSLAMLAGCAPLALYHHVNHPAEITDDFAAIADAARRLGIENFAQTVLLKGVNDQAPVLAALFNGLYQIGVKPAYLHLCDRAAGTRHFMVSPTAACDLWRDLWRHTPGAAIPHLVFDNAQRHSKVPLTDVLTVCPIEGAVGTDSGAAIRDWRDGGGQVTDYWV